MQYMPIIKEWFLIRLTQGTGYIIKKRLRSDLVWVVLSPGNQTIFLIVAPGSRWETSLTPIQSRWVTHLILHWNNNNCKIDTEFCAEVGLLLLKENVLFKSNSEVYALPTSHLPNATNFSSILFFFLKVYSFWT